MTPKTQTIQDFVKGLTTEEKDALLVSSLFTLERIALAGNCKLEPADVLAGSTIMGFGWFNDGSTNRGFVKEMMMRGTIPGL
jgi:hypothetical protein